MLRYSQKVAPTIRAVCVNSNTVRCSVKAVLPFYRLNCTENMVFDAISELPIAAVLTVSSKSLVYPLYFERGLRQVGSLTYAAA